jgi:hypothetical protein
MENPLRPWKEIARELAKETNRQRVTELSSELNRAIDEQTGFSRPVSSRGVDAAEHGKRLPNMPLCGGGNGFP